MRQLPDARDLARRVRQLRRLDRRGDPEAFAVAVERIADEIEALGAAVAVPPPVQAETPRSRGTGAPIPTTASPQPVEAREDPEGGRRARALVVAQDRELAELRAKLARKPRRRGGRKRRKGDGA